MFILTENELRELLVYKLDTLYDGKCITQKMYNDVLELEIIKYKVNTETRQEMKREKGVK